MLSPYTHTSLKRKLEDLEPFVSLEEVEKFKPDPACLAGENIPDYLARTAGIPGRDSSKLNLQVCLDTLITPLVKSLHSKIELKEQRPGYGEPGSEDYE
ncbi:hypothetical protein MMC31_004865 [Peltigera leucophlebia]|nr:hypothetical protein [Peltigera leucophlebia]